jgi:hypothetical protein
LVVGVKLGLSGLLLMLGVCRVVGAGSIGAVADCAVIDTPRSMLFAAVGVVLMNNGTWVVRV